MNLRKTIIKLEMNLYGPRLNSLNRSRVVDITDAGIELRSFTEDSNNKQEADPPIVFTKESLRQKRNGNDLYRIWQIGAFEDVYHEPVPPVQTSRIPPGREFAKVKDAMYDNIVPVDALYILRHYLRSLGQKIIIVCTFHKPEYLLFDLFISLVLFI